MKSDGFRFGGEFHMVKFVDCAALTATSGDGSLLKEV
jgi:hypothetical protein